MKLPGTGSRSRRLRLDATTAYTAVVDIGASSVVCLAGSESDEAAQSATPFAVQGIGIQASPGLSGGGIDDLNATEVAVRKAVDQAEKQIGTALETVYVNVSSGAFLQEKCRLDLALDGRAIGEEHVRELFVPLKSREAPRGYVVLKTTPRSYIVDHHRVVKDPRGLHAATLSAEVHRLFSLLSPIEDIVSCIHRCHLEVGGMYATAEASARATMVQEEFRHGAILLDIGAGSTSMCVFRDDELDYLARIPVAGHHFTRDLAQGLGIDLATAERLKVLHGTVNDPGATAAPISLSPGDNSTGERIEFTARQISSVMEPRARELLELVEEKARESGFRPRSPRFVLTGGCAMLSGLREMVVSTFNAQARIARPQAVAGVPEMTRTPSLSTAVGMLMMAWEAREG